MKYNPRKIESKWQRKWQAAKVFQAQDDAKSPKFYCLDMFPYPSGDGLHVGHPKGYTATDIVSRYKRMRGFNVLHPMGWDAFGLPAENYALKHKVHPRISTEKNIKRFKKQIQSLGFSYDWSREVSTIEPEYYKWTQWIFLKLFKAGLAYEAVVPINWCPKDKTGLANEEVVDGKCERCGTPVVKKDMKQWMLKITAYADRLLKDLDGLDWPEKIKEMQKNWIGKSEGVEINFRGTREWMDGDKLKMEEYDIPVFTTRADTLYGVTYIVLAPEHPLVGKLVAREMKKQVDAYLNAVKNKSDLERQAGTLSVPTATPSAAEKTGVFLGAAVVNPMTGEKVPVWVADYVLYGYGTGAVMAVPAHDSRDFVFAKKYDLPIKWVIAPPHDVSEARHENGAYEDVGTMVNSGEFNGLTSQDGKVKITDHLESKKLGRRQINYHLRDWVFSRQRYWGEPIPLIHCEKCGIVAVPEKDLPVRLPNVKKYEPTGTGESPLAGIKRWVETKCPKCGGKAKRETNTMPQWAGSCWYYLRYLDPKNKREISDKQIEKYWMTDLPSPLLRKEGTTDDNCPPLQTRFPSERGVRRLGGVDLYVGGAEHAVLHLLYSRFWHKFLFDKKVVSTKEPFAKLRNVGLILGPDGVKMSKSRGNVISPDDVVKEHGADTLRLYEMFIGEFEDTGLWNTESIIGVRRFLERVWNLYDNVSPFGRGSERGSKSAQSAKISVIADVESNAKLTKLLHKTIKKVTDDIENMKFNTAISAMMILVNEMYNSCPPLGKGGCGGVNGGLPKESYEILIKLIAPFAPHLAEELWERLGHKKSLTYEFWPEWSEALAKDDEISLVVQINGKLRATVRVPAGITEESAKAAAFADENIKKWIDKKEIKKVIFVKGKLVNIVI